MKKTANKRKDIKSQEWSDTFDSINDGISIHSLDFRILRANKALGDLLGADPGELVGKQCFRLVHGTGEPIANCPMAHYKACGQSTEIVRQEPHLGNRWLQVRCDPVLGPERRLTSMIHVIRDITENKKAAEELRKANERLRKVAENLKRQREILNIIVENTEAHLAYLDTKFNFIWVNSTYARGAGYTPKELVGKNHFALFPDEENKAIFKRVRDSGQTESFFNKPFVYENQPLRGTTYWDWTLAPVKDDEDKVQALVLSLIDTTAHMKVEQLKDEFVNMISHEMRTPLTVVIGALETVISEGKNLADMEKNNLLKDAIWGAQTLSHIQENLLELARSQANRLFLNPALMSIPDMAAKLVGQVRQNSKGHRFVIDMAEDLPLTEVDGLRLERILRNLLENAVKYSPKGGEIKVCGSVKEAEITIRVSDQGIGMSPEQQARLFKPFERLVDTGEGVKGIGLGLVVCQRLVEAHHGRIWVESVPGRGSTFYFTLPVTECQE